jgi:hypothetical protein
MPGITTSADVYEDPVGRPARRSGAPAVIDLYREKGVGVPEPAAAAAGDGDPPAAARVDYGRWLADCPAPGCKNAQLLDPADPRWFCVACHNADVGGRWRPVAWPADRAAVEAGLVDLPEAKQFWRP